eukprot:m.312663 g.312663  ORF g.312663 m.312663 type:complete len:504 (+) comp23048_c0_seq36:444-1955(+)
MERPVLECVVRSAELKLFAKAVQCLSRIGEELFLVASEDTLALRTVNQARTAYGCFNFRIEFFDQYSATPTLRRAATKEDQDEDEEEDDNLRCKVQAKACLAVFKSMGNIDRSVERCRITFDVEECHLVFVLSCRHDIKKTYRLNFEECETLQALFDKEACPNTLTVATGVLLDCLDNFQSGLEELSLKVSEEKITLSNKADDPDPDKQSSVLRTKLSLDPMEFVNYAISKPGEVAFCMKEFKAVLAYCDFDSKVVSLFFDENRAPVICSTSGTGYQADFVFATRYETQRDEGPVSSAPVRSSGADTPHQERQQPQHHHRSLHSSNSSPRDAPGPAAAVPVPRAAPPARAQAIHTPSRKSALATSSGVPSQQDTPPAAPRSHVPMASFEAQSQHPPHSAQKPLVGQSSAPSAKKLDAKEYNSDLWDEGDSARENSDSSDDEENGEYVAATPPASPKRTKGLFTYATPAESQHQPSQFSATTGREASQDPGSPNLLVEDSEDDD